MKQIVSNYTYSPTANCVTLTGLNIDQDQLLLVVAPEQGRTLYNFASVTGSVIPGSNTRINLSASTAGLTNSSPLVIFYDDQLSTQTIAGTVTANVFGYDSQNQENLPIGLISYGSGESLRGVTEVIGPNGNPLPISGTVTANLSSVPTHGVTIANSSVTVNGTFYQATQPVSLASLPSLTAGTAQIGSVTASISGTVPVSGIFWQATQPVSLASVPTHGVTIAAGTAQIGSVTASISGTVPVSGTFYQATQPVSIASLPASTVTVSSLPVISGTVTAKAFGLVDLGDNTYQQAQLNLAQHEGYFGNGIRLGVSIITNDGTEIGGIANPIEASVSNLPKITLIDGSGSVVTANSAIEVFATTTTRSYLLVQVTTGSAYVNVGATATTANGIYLASGQGYAWETTIPQGVCSLISTVTGTAYCAKQA